VFAALFRLKREERIERQQEQLRKLNSDMEEWRKELTVFRKEVTDLPTKYKILDLSTELVR